MKPSIVQLSEKKLMGLHITMSLANNKTGDLWKSFMQRRKEITNNLSNDLISLQVYNPIYFQDFKPTTTFEKWATTEVSDFNAVPKGMDTLVLESGLYAVFNYKGSSANTDIYQYIFGVWLKNSEYLLDDRPHFEVLGKNYNNADPSSEEEIWIPLKKK